MKQLTKTELAILAGNQQSLLYSSHTRGGLEMGKIVELNRDYIRGIHAAKMDIAKGDVYDLDGALYMFQIDPADTEFQRGYHAGLIQVYRQQNGGLQQ